ncbi:hypothetical protein ACS8GI_004158 [Vibrio vulnificus]
MLISLLLSLLCIPVLLMGNELAKQYSYYFFCSQLVIVFVYISLRGKILDFLRPSILAFLYISVSFTIGSWAFKHELVYSEINLSNFMNWKYYHFSTSVVLLMNSILFFVYMITKNETIREMEIGYDLKIITARVKKLLLVMLFFTTPFIFIDIDLSIFGGAGGIASIPKSVLAILFIYYFCLKGGKSRFLYYAVVIFLFSLFSFEDKRDAIFLIFPIAFLEFTFNISSFKPKVVAALFCSVIFLLFLIVLMSIARGYGGYEVDGVISALPFVIDYMRSDLFLLYLFNNIEVNYTFFHTIQSIEYVIDDFWIVSYGETLVKFLFLVVPRSIIDFKPSSFIELYTSTYDPAFRSIGGSWPPNFYAELFWNFHIISLVFCFIFFYIFEKLYIKAVRYVKQANYSYSVISIYMIYSYLVLIRGSGFDLFVFQCVIALFFCFISYMVIYCLIRD